MKAVVTTGSGGYDRLVYGDVPVPHPAAGEVLLQVLAAGVNNTDINTRAGWYAGGGWNGPTPFPLIQGTDCCGRIVEVGNGVDPGLRGRRVLVRPCTRPQGFASMECRWLGTDFDGAFAQYVKVPADETFEVHCDWSDAELASIPCAYGTAENMLHRARLKAGEHVLIAGASGGVGSAAVQLAVRRGAAVTAITDEPKISQVRALGAERVVPRNADLLECLGEESVDLIVDNVAGPAFPTMPRLLRRGGRYVSSGAIAGPQVELDMRTVYLKDLTLIGCTAWEQPVFASLIGCIERREIRPLVAKTFALQELASAQREFVAKRHVGKLVLLPPQ